MNLLSIEKGIIFFNKLCKIYMMKKFGVATIVAVGFLVMLGALNLQSPQQWSQITNKYVLTSSSLQSDLSSYFKEGYKTESSISSLFTYDREIVIEEEKDDKKNKEPKPPVFRKIETHCQDVLVNPEEDVDACLLAISLSNTGNLNADLTFIPENVRELDFDARYSNVDWESTTEWLQNTINLFTNLETISIRNYAGTHLFNMQQDLKAFKIYNNKVILNASVFENLSRTVTELVYWNSQLSNIDEIKLDRFMNLQHLDLSWNKLTTMHSNTTDFGIGSIVHLETLNLSHNDITDISGLYRTNAQPNNFTEINLVSNDIVEGDYGNHNLFLHNTRVNIDLSNNKIVDANKIFEKIRFDSNLPDEFQLLGEVNLTKNKITTLPNKAAEITHTLILKENDFSKFSSLDETAKLDTVLINKDDLKKEIWKGDIFAGDRVISIKPEYIGWFLAKGRSDDSSLKLSTLQETYIDQVLLPVAVDLYTSGVILENPAAITATLDDLRSSALGDLALDVSSVKEELNAPSSLTEFNVMVSLATNGINQEVVQSYTNYTNYIRIKNNIDSDTNSELDRTTLILIITLSALGIIIAAVFVGFYFFKGNKKRQKGDF